MIMCVDEPTTVAGIIQFVGMQETASRRISQDCQRSSCAQLLVVSCFTENGLSILLYRRGSLQVKKRWPRYHLYSGWVNLLLTFAFVEHAGLDPRVIWDSVPCPRSKEERSNNSVVLETSNPIPTHQKTIRRWLLAVAIMQCSSWAMQDIVGGWLLDVWGIWYPSALIFSYYEEDRQFPGFRAYQFVVSWSCWCFLTIAFW
jgi:hypothetical protein